MNDRNLIGEIIVRDLHSAEEASSAALAANSQLTLTMIESRKAAGLSATVGIVILETMHEAQRAHLQALRHTAHAHRLTQALGERLGVTAGTPTDKEDFVPPATGFAPEPIEQHLPA